MRGPASGRSVGAMFRSTAVHQPKRRARALDMWRDAAFLVQSRWDDFLVADPASRRGAFAAYMAAVDAEAVAAGELAYAHSPVADAA
jgi:hypothetical protein